MKKAGLIIAIIAAIVMPVFYFCIIKGKESGNVSDSASSKVTDETEMEFFDWIKQLTGEDVWQPQTAGSTGSYMIGRVPHYILVNMAKNGCESIAAVSALQYAGVNISVNNFIDFYLDKKYLYYDDGRLTGYSPEEYYINNPYDSSGWYCYEDVIINALNKFVDTDMYEIKKLTGTGLEEIVDTYIKNDIPVVTWLTVNAELPKTSDISWTIQGTDREYFPYTNVHCVVLVGYDEKYYYFNDSITGAYRPYDKEAVNAAYNQIGMRAIVVKKK